MAVKPKAGGSKKPPPKKMTKAEQFRAFIKIAREIGVDETGMEFDEAIGKVIRSRESRRYVR